MMISTSFVVQVVFYAVVGVYFGSKPLIQINPLVSCHLRFCCCIFVCVILLSFIKFSAGVASIMVYIEYYI